MCTKKNGTNPFPISLAVESYLEGFADCRVGAPVPEDRKLCQLRPRKHDWQRRHEVHFPQEGVDQIQELHEFGIVQSHSLPSHDVPEAVQDTDVHHLTEVQVLTRFLL